MKTKSCLINIIIILNSFSISSQVEIVSDKNKQCPPCKIINSEKNINQKLKKWPEFNEGDLIKINSLTSILYNRDITFDNKWIPNNKQFYVDQFKAKGFIKQAYEVRPWWKEKGLDPWSDLPFWGWKGKYKEPIHDFDECVNDNLRWMCGYSYVVDFPKAFDQKKYYPLVIFLHGTVDQNKLFFYHRERIRMEIFKPEDDPYIYAAPIKLEVDWNADKIFDMIENIKQNINIDTERIYLTGLSMGGRGTYIVASELQNTFAALMVVSPHHGPFNYVKLANKLKNIPIFITHGDVDEVSSFEISKQMFTKLKSMGSETVFKRRKNIGHTSWYKPYRDSTNIKWLLSWKKKDFK
mgnify:FL=1